MAVERMDFKTEVKQILDLMIHSLYSHKEIFLRELISNASDAIDKARYEALTHKEISDEAGEWKIRLTADKIGGFLTISDNGIGMTKEEMVEALGTIAHSGTKDFIRALQEKDLKERPELIGQFGVGFYSSFMVADRVTVITKRAGIKDARALKWESSADGSFTIEEASKDKPGTDVVLHLKKDELKYLDEWEIRNIVRKYSDYIEHPVVMDVEREKESELEKGKKFKTIEEETLNSRKAIWLKDKAEITKEEYNEFYRHVSHDFRDPSRVIHYKAEGTSEFTALLYIPSKAPFGILYKDFKFGPALYVRRVQIMDHCEELLPPYLRFVRGIVDSSDLPLNVSREMLQSNRQVDIIRKNLSKKIFDTMAEMKKENSVEYSSFYAEFGRILKEGIHLDFSRKEQIADLMLLGSMKTDADGFTSFEEYVSAMKPAQEDIYYITASSREEALRSPYVEAFRERDMDVLIMLDEIDDIIMGSLMEYKGKKIKSVIKGDIKLDSEKKPAGSYEKLIGAIREELKDEVKDVRTSGRLTDSACCLVTEEGGIDPNMERLLKSMGQSVPSGARTLEINPSHPVFETMNALMEKDSSDPMIREYIRMLYDQALLLEGSKPKDPVAFAKYVSRLMIEGAKSKLMIEEEKH